MEPEQGPNVNSGGFNEWIQSFMEANAANTQRLQEQNQAQAESIRLLTEQVRQLAEHATLQVPRPPTTPSVVTPDGSTIGTPTNGRRPKPHLPNPETFDSESTSEYPQFVGKLRAKLSIDGPAIGGEQEKVWYGFGRLTGKAATRVFLWMEYAQKEGKFTVDGFFEQMKVAFADPRQEAKALHNLGTKK
jgi:hypothetical protein